MYQIKNIEFNGDNSIAKNQKVSSGGFAHFKQSPKIASGILRTSRTQFSLLDINPKKLARGLKLPKQYKRQNPQINTERSNSFQVKQDHDVEQYKRILDNKRKNIQSANVYNYNNIRNFVKEQDRQLYSSLSQRSTSINKEIRNRMNESDIFFLKKTKDYQENFPIIRNNYLNESKLNYQESDLFNTKKNNVFNEKSGERFLDKDQGKSFTVSNASNSQWAPKPSTAPTLLNHTSVGFHILNPGIKAISKTKEDVIQENQHNPLIRKKGMCEFIDFTKNVVPNTNKEYFKHYNNDDKVFRIKKNLCSTYLDIHREYKGISDPPFVKKIV